MMSNISLVSKNEGHIDSCYDTSSVDLRKCTFVWTLVQYSTLAKSKTDVKSSAISDIDGHFKWYLEHKIWMPFRDHPTVLIYLKPDLDDLRKYGGVSVNVKVSVVRPDYTEIKTTVSCAQLDWDGDTPKRECYVGSFGCLSEVLQWVHDDKLRLSCELSYFHTANLRSSCYSTPVNISESSLSTDFERFFIDDNDFKDVTICVKGKNYRVHKTVLAARSSVFNAMFKSDMRETRKNCTIDIPDIEQDMFEEILHYIYTGKTKNLEESAFELLPAADKYDLRVLKTMCEEVLLRKLSTDNAARILILADMHHSRYLKAHVLRFVKVNHPKCKDFKKTDVWNVVTKSRPHLMEELLGVFFQ